MSQVRPSFLVDVSTMRLGDRMACAWWAQERRLKEGVRFAVVDRQERLAQEFSLPRYFPATFEPAESDSRLPVWDPGNLWLTVTQAFHDSRRPGHFEALPEEVLRRARELRQASLRQRLLVHVLDDAPYNRARNWSRSSVAGLKQVLSGLPIDCVLLNPQPGIFLGSYDEMLAQMLAADLFIGGDTGPSHVFAMLCPEKPQLAIYPDMRRDQARYAAEQASRGLAHAWNSLPKRPGLDVLTLRPSRQWEWEGWRPHWRRAGLFAPGQVRQWVEERLQAPPSPPPAG